MRALRGTGRRLAAVIVALVALTPVFVALAAGKARTALMSGAPGLVADGASDQPALSADGSTVAFASTATNLGGLVPGGGLASIYSRSRATGRLRLVSSPSPTVAADAGSAEPAISADGATIAWSSPATNLVPGDINATTDVFARIADGPIILVSASATGGAADGPSSQPALSGNGRYVAFTSTADDLVPGDTNGVADVFVRDLATNRTTLVSRDNHDVEGNGASTEPALNADGTVISFSSAATNLVPGDTNATGDVFVRVLPSGRIQRVSVGRGGVQQNLSVSGPFPQISSLSDDGRYVAFDSDATNLVRGDVNHHTDVFVFDRKAQTTVLASLSSANVQGNSDSFFPHISGDGRYVAFESFASNLVPGDPVREDVFLRDIRLQATSLVDVANDGSNRAPESVPQLLQRAQVSSNADVAAFVSTAGNLVPGDANGLSDVFARRMTAARTSAIRVLRGGARPQFRLGSNNARAVAFLCRVDKASPVTCRPGRWQPRGTLAPGRHRLVVSAGGPGLKFDPSPRTLSFTVR